MSFIVVPKEAGTDWADVRIATDEDPPSASAGLHQPGGVAGVGAAWQAWHRADEDSRLHHQRWVARFFVGQPAACVPEPAG